VTDRERPHPSAIDARARRRLADLETRGLLRELTRVDGVDLCSNDYLGLRDHAGIRARVAAAGAVQGAGASRLLSGNLPEHERLENRLAAWLNAESSLLFATGWMASYGVCATLPVDGDVVFSDALNHASLIDGLKASGARCIVFPHRDVAALEAAFETARPADGGTTWIVTESLFSMDGTVAPLDSYAALADRHDSSLIVDEAHAIGVLGDGGRGLVGAAVAATCAARVVTFGKALGTQGAAVVCSRLVRQWLLNACRTVIYTTAPSPLAVAAVDAALDVITADSDLRGRVARLGDHLRVRCRAAGLTVPSETGPIIPLIIGDVDRALAAAAGLREAGFFVRALRPPTVPEGTARLRLSVTARHDEPTLDRAVEVLVACLPAAGEGR